MRHAMCAMCASVCMYSCGCTHNCLCPGCAHLCTHTTNSPHPAACRPRRDTGPTWNCTDFADISKTDEYYSCQDFNDWKLGLSNLADAGPYLSGLSSTDTAALSVAYLSKKIFYILGEDDVCNCLSKEVTNPAICIRPNQTCSPVGEDTSPNCCDMPAPITRNVMIDISCGDMLEVGGGGGDTSLVMAAGQCGRVCQRSCNIVWFSCGNMLEVGGSRLLWPPEASG